MKVTESMTEMVKPHPAYKPQPLRQLEDIRADVMALERETEGLLGEIVGGRQV